MHLLLRLGSVLVLVAAGAGCGKPATGDVLSQDGDKSVAMTVNCLEPVADGTCNKKTCKKDSDSDCADFAKGCLDSKHHYDGTTDEGTCTRVRPNV